MKNMEREIHQKQSTGIKDNQYQLELQVLLTGLKDQPNH
jgi:hypothetical protein